MVIVGEAGVEHRLFLGLDHGVVFAFVVVAQTNVFHGSSPLSEAIAAVADLLSLFRVTKRNAS
jgi:hypothetical protein